MKVAVFTSVTASYLPNARILCNSVKEHHSDWDFYLLLNDRTPDFIRWEEEPFDSIFFAEWLDIRRPWLNFSHYYSVIEMCTATKGSMARHILTRLGYDYVVYLDPDTRVYSQLVEVTDIFENGLGEVVLTPHLTDPEEDDEGIWSHEIAALKHGVFNLGFFAIKNGNLGLKFLEWWERRLLDYSYIDFNYGTFTDQKWVNLSPYMFDGIFVLCHRSYNVATWNHKGRILSRDERGKWLVNGFPLRFYHFSGFGSDFAWADRELKVFAKNDPYIIEIWDSYKELYSRNKLSQPAPEWEWGMYRSGVRIKNPGRRPSKDAGIIDPY